MNLKEVLEKYLENQSEDLYDLENILSDDYGQILEHQELLSQLPIICHHRILSKALQKASSSRTAFPYSKFIDLVIYIHENQNTDEIYSLLSHFSIFDFPISDIEKLHNIHDFDDRYFQQRPHQLTQMILENHKLKSQISELKQRNHNYSIIEEMSSNIKTLQNSMNLIDDKINTITTQTSNSKIIEDKVEEINNKTNNIKNIENQLNSIEKKINTITTQTSNSKIIENNVQRINSNVDQIQQIDSSLIKQIRDICNENQTNIIQHVDILHHVKAFPRIPEKPYSGILNYCQSINHLKLTSYVGAWKGALENILKSPGYYLSYRSSVNHWIEFDFDCKVVKLLSYEIQSITSDYNYLYPISWKMMGSNDRNKWDDLDVRTNCNELKEVNRDAYFACNLQSRNYYRYIRFLQTKGSDSIFLHISRIELYGNVF